nr:Chain C, Pam2CSK4 [synthetic construct]
CSKKKK